MSWRRGTRALRFAAGLAQAHPFNVLVQVTNRCNLTCSFCDFWANGAPPRQELTLSDLHALSKDLAEVGCFLVSIEGGEPTLRADLVEIVRAFSRFHLPVLYTNGWFIDAARAQSLFDAGLHMVGVSIDFADAQRHDQKRGRDGVWDRAWAAVDHFKAAAPNGGGQVHVMTVLMDDNQEDWEPLVQLSHDRGVGHAFTLLSTQGFRRKDLDNAVPTSTISQTLLSLWERYPGVMGPRQYLAQMDAFLERGPMPTCRAGLQSFNVDHLGNVSPCIEKIDRHVGNVREEPLRHILPRLKTLPEIKSCQDCWTLCRGTGQLLGGGGSWEAWRDLATRMSG